MCTSSASNASSARENISGCGQSLCGGYVSPRVPQDQRPGPWSVDFFWDVHAQPGVGHAKTTRKTGKSSQIMPGGQLGNLWQAWLTSSPSPSSTTLEAPKNSEAPSSSLLLHVFASGPETALNGVHFVAATLHSTPAPLLRPGTARTPDHENRARSTASL